MVTNPTVPAIALLLDQVISAELSRNKGAFLLHTESFTTKQSDRTRNVPRF